MHEDSEMSSYFLVFGYVFWDILRSSLRYQMRDSYQLAAGKNDVLVV
jgi:hypothetical protein